MVVDGGVSYRPPLSIFVMPGVIFFIVSHTSIDTIVIVMNEARNAAVPPAVVSRPNMPM